MLKTIILIFVCVLMGIFVICAFILAQAEKKERYKIQKQLDEVYEHGEPKPPMKLAINKHQQNTIAKTMSIQFNQSAYLDCPKFSPGVSLSR